MARLLARADHTRGGHGVGHQVRVRDRFEGELDEDDVVEAQKLRRRPSVGDGGAAACRRHPQVLLEGDDDRVREAPLIPLHRLAGRGDLVVRERDGRENLTVRRSLEKFRRGRARRRPHREGSVSCTSCDDQAAWIRGRQHASGVGPDLDAVGELQIALDPLVLRSLNHPLRCSRRDHQSDIVSHEPLPTPLSVVRCVGPVTSSRASSPPAKGGRDCLSSSSATLEVSAAVSAAIRANLAPPQPRG